MAYVQPNTIIEVMENVPITPSYNDTLYFGSYSDQNTYFSTQVKYTFSKQYYQRVGKNRCRVEKNAENLYNCNYMRFKNYAYGNKWFYAFILEVEYINDNVSEIIYEIDELQTWYFDMVLGQCFVEREHATSDNVGEHLLPEPVDTGESVCNGLISGGFTDLSILLLWGEADGIELCLRDGVYSDVGMMSAPYSTEGATSIKNTLEGIFGQTGGADSIVALYMVPSVMLSNNNLSTPYTTTKAISRPTSVGTKTPFTPKNKKLLTFPYTYLCVDTLDQSQVYKYERFVNSGNNVGFKITGTYLNNPTFACAPMDYEFSGVNHTNQVLMAGYPMCIINVNTYKQWISNNWAHVLTGMASSVGSIALGAASGSITGSVVGMIGLGKNIADLALESNRVNTARGSFTSSINAQARTKDIYFKRMTILYERAKSIDEFFDRYGYACERVKTPNIHARQNWTYTKTRGCVVKGKLPASSARKIADIFDKGITFWVSAVGNYSISNPTL